MSTIQKPQYQLRGKLRNPRAIQPKAKKIKWMKNQLDGRFEETIVDMELAIDCIEPSHILLKVFQFQKPLIHLIKPTILGFAKESFQEITAIKNLKHSDGRVMGGNN